MANRAEIDIRLRATAPWVPPAARIRGWVRAALPARRRTVVSIHVVGDRTARRLNARYRGRDYATNVLSFAGPGRAPDGEQWLGELVICAPVLAREARAGRKSMAAHWAHITVHGVLHLLGFDHLEAGDARKMQSREVRILARMGFANPYLRGY